MFLGRSAELATFDAACTDAGGGLPSTLLISGDAGIGKSALLTEGARRSGFPLHLGRCLHVGGDPIPFAPLAGLLRQVRRTATDTVPEAELLSSTRAGDLFATVLDLIGNLASGAPAVVGIEDLHWADEATWDLFEFLARNLVDERVVLVGTHRANEANANPVHRRRLAELSRLPGAQRIALTGLSQENVAARVTDLMGRPASTALVEEVLVRGQGNPFFTDELVAAHLAGHAIPIVLSDLILADISSLDPSAREVLAAVAAIGRATSHELLAAVADLDEDAVEAGVRAAVDANLLMIENQTYRFRHALIGEVSYADLLPPHRIRLHRRMAETLQAAPLELLDRADRATELAFHLDRSGDAEAAFTALLAAADMTESVAPGAAFGHLERALEIWDVAGEAAAGQRRSDRMWQAAELADATVGSDRAVALARAAMALGPPPQGAAWGHERLGRYLWTSGALQDSQVEFEHAAASLSSHDDAEAARVFAGLGQAEFMSGHFASADGLSRRAIELTPTLDPDPLTWVLARHVQGSVRNHLGDPDAGVELCREAFLNAPTAHSRGMAAFLFSVLLLSAGRTEEAISVALDAVAEGHRAGLDRSLGALTDTVAAEGLTRLGRWQEAEAVLARHLAYDTAPLAALRVARAAAMLAARQGDSGRALGFLADANAHPVDGMHLAFLDQGAADVHLILGDWTAAATAAERGWNNHPTGVPLWAARFAMLSIEATVEQTLDALAARQPTDLPATVTHLQGRIDAIREETRRHPERAPSLDTVAHLTHAIASLTRLTGPDPTAWSGAARAWSDLGDRWWTALARLRESDAAASTGNAAHATTSLRDAHRLANDIGAQPIITAAEAISRRTRISLDEPTRVDLDASSVAHLGLTPREAEVLALVSGGQTNRQIGLELFVSEKTAGVHVSNILRKLGVSSRVDAAAIAQRLGVA